MTTKIAMAAALAAAVTAGGCAKPEASEPNAAQPVRTHVAAATATASSVRYSASIEPFEQVTLSFKASGYVDEVLRRTGADGRLRTVQAGDHIGKGTVLARVRESDYRERVSQGRARLAESEASLTKARLDLERARTLFASDSLTKPELDAAQAAFDAARARVASAQADIELAQSALGDTALIAPSSGVVLERRIEAGSLAAVGTAAFVLAEVSSVKARFGIPDGMIHSVRLGDAIDVIVESADGAPFPGHVTAIAPAAEAQSRVFDVEVTVSNRDRRLRPGMIGTVVLGRTPGAAAAAADAQLTVPLTAVVRADAAGQFAVVVVEQTKGAQIARLRRVELGEVFGNAIAIRSGLAAGERVVVSGASMLIDGDHVQSVDAAL
jgi:RND family efflux transporter MFP subunit